MITEPKNYLIEKEIQLQFPFIEEEFDFLKCQMPCKAMVVEQNLGSQILNSAFFVIIIFPDVSKNTRYKVQEGWECSESVATQILAGIPGTFIIHAE